MKKFDDFSSEDRIKNRLLEKSVHFLIGEISEENANDTIKWIIYENLDPKPLNSVLTLYINSQGGDLYQALALIDVMRSSKLPIRTIGIGNIMSAAFLIFSCGTQGERFSAPSCGFMCHQMSISEEAGKYHDIKAGRKETDRLDQVMLDILIQNSGLTKAQIRSKLLKESDVYLSAEEAKAFGIVDHILE